MRLSLSAEVGKHVLDLGISRPLSYLLGVKLHICMPSNRVATSVSIPLFHSLHPVWPRRVSLLHLANPNQLAANSKLPKPSNSSQFSPPSPSRSPAATSSCMSFIGNVARAGRRYCLSELVTSGDSPSFSRPDTISSTPNSFPGSPTRNWTRRTTGSCISAKLNRESPF